VHPQVTVPLGNSSPLNFSGAFSKDRGPRHFILEVNGGKCAVQFQFCAEKMPQRGRKRGNDNPVPTPLNMPRPQRPRFEPVDTALAHRQSRGPGGGASLGPGRLSSAAVMDYLPTDINTINTPDLRLTPLLAGVDFVSPVVQASPRTQAEVDAALAPAMMAVWIKDVDREIKACGNSDAAILDLVDLIGRQAGMLNQAQFGLADAEGEGQGRETLLYRCTDLGRGDLVAQLLRTPGISVDASSRANITPLFHAVRRGKRDIARLLLQNNANVNYRNDRGLSPFNVALKRRRFPMAAILLESQADTAPPIAGKRQQPPEAYSEVYTTEAFLTHLRNGEIAEAAALAPPPNNKAAAEADKTPEVDGAAAMLLMSAEDFGGAPAPATEMETT
jgi:hypothetical protein